MNANALNRQEFTDLALALDSSTTDKIKLFDLTKEFIQVCQVDDLKRHINEQLFVKHQEMFDANQDLNAIALLHLLLSARQYTDCQEHPLLFIRAQHLLHIQ